MEYLLLLCCLPVYDCIILVLFIYCYIMDYNIIQYYTIFILYTIMEYSLLLASFITTNILLSNILN